MNQELKKVWLILAKHFGNQPFTSKEAEKVLGNRLSNVHELLAQLHQQGLMTIQSGQSKKKQSIYQLTRSPSPEILPQSTPNSISKDELLRLLKQGADIIRTRVDYKVLLVLLFYKAISDKYKARVEEYKKNGRTEERSRELANTNILKIYDVQEKKSYLWHDLVHEPESFIQALTQLEDLNSDFQYLKGLKALIERTGLPSLFYNKDNRRIIMQLIDLFGSVDFSNINYDILGDAYEWILSYFAPENAKEGEVYTPIEVSRLMASLANPSPKTQVILDPACGSGSMLIEFYRIAKENNAEPMLYGQEANEVSAILARLNFILHGIKDVTIFTGDSLLNPQFKPATISTANPPWNQKGYDQKVLETGQITHAYRYGYPTQQSADWAWIQLLTHMTEQLSTIVIDTGALFRGGREKQIRQAFIKNDLIEAVILLPEKIFYNTQAPAAILVINKQKPKERQGKVLFINASNEYRRHPEVKRLNQLAEEHIQKIANTYHQFQEQPGFSQIATLEEIQNNDFNLNVPLYVAPPQEDEEIDLEEELKELKKLGKEYEEKMLEVVNYITHIVKAENN